MVNEYLWNLYYVWQSHGIILLFLCSDWIWVCSLKSWSLWEWCWISILHIILTVGPFESDALLVPQHCHFYHEHNQCDTYKKWGDWATADCQAKDMRIDSFSMLLDCDIDRFAGVEYVCCPKEKSKSSIISPVRQCLPLVCTGDGMHYLSCKNKLLFRNIRLIDELIRWYQFFFVGRHTITNFYFWKILM